MKTPRTAIVEIDVPAHVSDQDFANLLRRVIAQACQPGDPTLVYADRDSLEVTVFGCPATQLFPSFERSAP